jgi:tRNA(Phe) wybutosine-synthesizing methylase Tyw3
MAKMTLNEQAQEIIRIAEESGVQSNFFFITTFKRYQVQLNMLTELEKKMKDDGMLVTKEYVKGRKNLYSNPALKEYNTTTDSANRTVSTLMKIIKNYNVDDGETEVDEDPLLKAINGSDDDEE